MYLDLEDPRDFAKLQELLAFLEANKDSLLCIDWRINYIRMFLERDIPQLGITIPAETLRRFWIMLAHVNGTALN